MIQELLRPIAICVVGLLFGGTYTSLSAQDVKSASDAESRTFEVGPFAKPGVAVQVDFQAFADSSLGQQIIAAALKMAGDQLGQERDVMGAIRESLGFDPFTQNIKIRMSILDIEDSLNDTHVMLTMAKSTGNLEGMLLAAPGYESKSVSGQTVHSLDIDGQQVFIAFGQATSGDKQVAVSSSQAAVVAMMKTPMDTKSPLASNMQWKVPAGQFLVVAPSQIPNELVEDTPLKNITPLISSAFLSLGQHEDMLKATFRLDAIEEPKALQIQQLAQGIVAMASLFQNEIAEELDGDEMADIVVPVLQSMKVERSKNSVNVSTQVPTNAVIEFLRAEAGLPL
ncbi:MAG: hypothetical protein AAF802_11730 [Planctomycetota bacterium]